MLRYSLVLLAAAILAPPAQAHSHKRNGMEIVHPWTSQTKEGATTALVSMTIRNRTGKPDRLLSASTPRAGKVELDDAGRGRAAFAVGEGAELELHRGGPHLVLTGLKEGLDAYDDFKMTLVFEHAGPVAIDVMVEEAE